MTQDQLKQAVAQAAVDHILPKLNDRSIVGVGTGSTANFFIDLLAKLRASSTVPWPAPKPPPNVSSSTAFRSTT